MIKWILLSIIIAFTGLVDLFVILFVTVSWSCRWVWHHHRRLIPCVFLLIISCNPIVGDNPGAAGIASAKVRAAHIYHGGPHGVRSIEDWTGEYFYRDGNRCRLFTKGFETKWRAK